MSAIVTPPFYASACFSLFYLFLIKYTSANTQVRIRKFGKYLIILLL